MAKCQKGKMMDVETLLKGNALTLAGINKELSWSELDSAWIVTGRWTGKDFIEKDFELAVKELLK